MGSRRTCLGTSPAQRALQRCLTIQDQVHHDGFGRAGITAIDGEIQPVVLLAIVLDTMLVIIQGLLLNSEADLEEASNDVGKSAKHHVVRGSKDCEVELDVGLGIGRHVGHRQLHGLAALSDLCDVIKRGAHGGKACRWRLDKLTHLDQVSQNVIVETI